MVFACFLCLSACGGEADHLPKRDSRSRKCTPQICSERVVIANKKIAMSPFSAAPQGTKSVPRTASERNGGTRLQHVWNSEGKTCTSFWSLWGRYGSHSGLIFGPSGANLGALRPKWLASGVLGALGVLWGSSGGRPEPFLGAHWGHLGPSWGRQGQSWGHLGAILTRLGAILGHLGAPLGLPWGSWRGFGSHRGAVSTNRNNHRKTICFSTILASRGPS